MSSIPPNFIGSVLQSGIAQQTQSKDRETEENTRTDTSRKMNGAAGAGDIIEIEATDTDDTEVHSDTGGTGGQGRYDTPPEDQVDDAAGQKEEAGVRYDEHGRPHLDLSA